ncbi:MAG TPA: sodium:solute symporter family protein [Vicinamibacterales bacterium]|jgi:SSS family solute:Na+ symporter|nr:sodium:solute symporter family protein [Vicinamibacterales bacterium]
MNLHLALLIVYSVALVAIGLSIARLIKGSADFFVAGRSLTAPLLFATVLASNIGAGATIGATGRAYFDGISAWWWNGASALGSVFLAFFIGPRIWRAAKANNLLTTGDFLELRYGGLVRALVTMLIWLGTLSIFAGQLIAGAAVLDVVAGVPRWEGTVISAVVVTTTFMAGGLLGTAWVNVVQLTVLLAGFVVAVPTVLAHAGGLAGIARAPDVPATFVDPLYSGGPLSGWSLLVFAPAFVISPGLMQKAYGADSERTVRLGIGLQAAALAIFAFVPALLGMAARATHPGLTNPNIVLPTLLVEQLPPWFGALALAAVFSAEVSACDAILFMLATSLSQDLYKRFLHPDADDRDVLLIARLASLAGGAGGVVLALLLETVQQALAIFYSLLGVSLLMPVVGGLYLRRAGAREALASLAAGNVTLLVVRFVVPASYAWIDPTVAGLIASAAAFFAVYSLRRGPVDVRHGPVGSVVPDHDRI